jgi:hypothetical protein
MSTVSLRPQLNRDDLARLQWLLGTTVAVLSASTVFFLDVQAWWLVAAIGAAAVAGVCWPAWPARVPTWVHRLAFPIILGTFAFDLFFGREPLPALIRLDLLLILYRLISHRSRREDLQLLVLGLFLIVVAGVLSVSIAFAGQISGLRRVFAPVPLRDHAGRRAPARTPRGHGSELDAGTLPGLVAADPRRHRLAPRGVGHGVVRRHGGPLGTALSRHPAV